MLYLIKIGGSLITDKTKPYTIRPEAIESICKEISTLIERGYKLIIGSGAGSFAHFSAKKYNTVNGFVDGESRFGLTQVQYDAAYLHSIVTQKFLEYKTTVFSFAPSSFIHLENGVVSDLNLQLVEQAMKNLLTPFLYGDVVLDTVRGCGILSTDIIFEEIGKNLAKKGEEIAIISVGDYDGVLDSNNNLITHISAHEDTSKYWHETNNIDVTGGMKTKVESMQRLAKDFNIRSVIVNGSIEGRLTKVIEGKHAITTVIE